MKQAIAGGLLALSLVASASAQTYRSDRPVRGVWYRGPSDVAVLESYMQKLAAAGMRHMFLETFYHGLSTGKQGVFNSRYGSFDYLAAAISLGAKYNIRLHAWCEAGYWQFGNEGSYNFTDHPEWRVFNRSTSATGGDAAGQVFANLCNPGVQDKLRQYCAELADYPGLWGIMTDYHRFPLDNDTTDAYPAPWSYEGWTRGTFMAVSGVDPWAGADTPSDAAWSQFLTWRRNGISEAANQMHLGIQSTNPEVTFSSAMFAAAMIDSTQIAKCQDWPSWASHGYVDWLCPMAYGSTTSSITNDLNITKASAAGRRVVAGLALTGSSTHPSVTSQLNAIKGVSIQDFIIFDGDGSAYADTANQTNTKTWITSATKMRADFNNDEYVDGRDWTLFKTLYHGTPVSGTGRNARYDFNGDGIVDAADEALFKTQFIKFHFGDDGVVSLRDRIAFHAAMGTATYAGVYHLYDLNADGVVDAADLALLNEISPPPPCPADFNGDGAVDFFDYDDFVACFEGDGCPQGKTSDFNGDGASDFFDYDDFVAAYETPCL